MYRPTCRANALLAITTAALLVATACSDSTQVEPGPDAEDTTAGDFSVEPDVAEPFCGNGVIDDGEECDDKNGVDADACSNDCELNNQDLCAACETDDDCGGGGQCLPMTGGTYCGFDCSGSPDYCPEGFDCVDITDPEDTDRVIAQQCVPLESCGAVDECTAFPDICGPGDCVDQEVGYSCSCDPGYEQTGDRPTCTDVDECDDVDICGVGTCSNLDGGFACDCPFPYVDSGTTCAICPPEFALTLTMPSTSDCLPLAEEDHQALLDRAIENFGRVATNAIEAPRFIELSPIMRTLEKDWELFGCREDDRDCTPGIPFAEAADFIAELVSVMHEELVAADLVTASDACSMTIELDPEMLCDQGDEPLPVTCSIDDDCPGDYHCNVDTCERMACTGDDDCNEDYVCGDDDFCEADCIFDRLPIRIVAWPVDDQNVYAEILIGADPNAANPFDVRIFDNQLSVIVDLTAAIETAYLVSDAQGDEEPMWPAVEDVEGIVEIDLHEVSPGQYAFEVNVRKAGPDSAYDGIHAEWTIDEAFGSYVNETPLPLSLDMAQACPLVFLDANDSDNVLSLGTGIRPIEALVPFALVNSGDAEMCEVPTPCCGNPEGCCTDGDGLTVPCCIDDLGRIGCCWTEAPCPYDEDGDQMACLPNVGSLKLHLAGQSIRISTSVGDEHEDEVRIDRLGFGGGITSLERDGLTADQFDPILTFSHNLTTGDPTSTIVLRLAENERGVLADLVSELELDATFDTVNISDRITDMPDMLDGEVMRVLFTGAAPNLRGSIFEHPVRPVEVLGGVLTLYSQYLEDNENPPRDPPGTVTISAGECIVEMQEPPEGEDAHPFELIEGEACPDVAPLVDDVEVLLDFPDTNYEESSSLTVGIGRMALLTFDLANLPSTVSSARVDLYLDWTNGTLSGDFGVVEVTESWDASTVTWNSRPNIAGSPTDTISASDLQDSYSDYVSFDVTSLVNAWLANPSSNHGMAIRNATSEGYAVFQSQDDNDGARAPRLVFTE